jgi:hypothetical protein
MNKNKLLIIEKYYFYLEPNKLSLPCRKAASTSKRMEYPEWNTHFQLSYYQMR